MVADRDRPARVDDAVDLAHVGQRRLGVLGVEALEGIGQRDREQPSWGEVLAGAGEEGGAAVLAEELDGLHRDDHEREAPPERERARVRGDRLDRQAVRALAQRVEQLGFHVERDDGVPAPGQVERDASGPRPDIQHRAWRVRRELAPERQVLVVAAALEVVPQHRGGRAHANELPATPRATSRSRSASMAV